MMGLPLLLLGYSCATISDMLTHVKPSHMWISDLCDGFLKYKGTQPLKAKTFPAFYSAHMQVGGRTSTFFKCALVIYKIMSVFLSPYSHALLYIDHKILINKTITKEIVNIRCLNLQVKFNFVHQFRISVFVCCWQLKYTSEISEFWLYTSEIRLWFVRILVQKLLILVKSLELSSKTSSNHKFMSKNQSFTKTNHKFTRASQKCTNYTNYFIHSISWLVVLHCFKSLSYERCLIKPYRVFLTVLSLFTVTSICMCI